MVRDCFAFGAPLGEAFQLRDDLLGLFGRCEQTNKPAVDDLRQGKSTVPMVLALQQADKVQRTAVRRLVGFPALYEDGAVRPRPSDSGRGGRGGGGGGGGGGVIADRHSAALLALDGGRLHPVTVTALREPADAAAVSSS
ncbi:polyprenyl synthetase family protein [Streptomyces sp. NPDC059605]|uniref:polyprenyl synthetase family protein n=1 Tax=unclassified Streptomyces TaxID=2593676 RepID=UPI0036C34E49